MKKTITHITAMVLLAGAISSCAQDVEPLVNEAPQVVFTMDDQTINAKVGDEVDFTVDILAGDRLNCGWYVNDVLEASTAAFSYVFTSPGTYTVRFEAKNGSGSQSHSYTVVVTDILKISLSTADSTEIVRHIEDVLKVKAIVSSGEDVSHSWTVTDGEGRQVAESAAQYFDSFILSELTQYTVSYTGTNAVGSWSASFKINIIDKPLNIEFSYPQGDISVSEGADFQISANVISGSDGLRHSWRLDGTEVSTDALWSNVFTERTSHTITYYGVNAKEETFTGEWTLTVTSAGYLIDDFEGKTAIDAWWSSGNNPGITLEDNPDKSGNNTSDKVMKNSVYGTGSTSGVFDFKLSEINKVMQAENNTVSNYTGLRFKIWFGTNKYYPRISYNGKEHYPVVEPTHEQSNVWVELVFDFGSALDPNKNMQIRPLLNENHQNIGNDGDRTVYMDDFEFLK